MTTPPNLNELGAAYRLGGGATVINSYVAVAFANGDDARRFCELLKRFARPPADKTKVDPPVSAGYFNHGTGGGNRNIRGTNSLT